MTAVLPENDESQRAWDGVLFDRFVQYRALVVSNLAQHGVQAMKRFPPPEGARVLDIGCGFVDSSLQLAELVGPMGTVLGVDISPRFIEAARARAGRPRLPGRLAAARGQPVAVRRGAGGEAARRDPGGNG